VKNATAAFAKICEYFLHPMGGIPPKKI